MQFIVSGQRIAVENFVTGKLYTILWKTDTQVTLTCISIGADCVVFQGEAPLNLFTLTMQNADTIDTIEPTQLGTTNYNNLINKPSINGVDLIGNKTSAALGIRDVPTIIESDDGKILTANSDGTYTWQPVPSSGTMDYTQLNNKPQINSVTLTGNVSLSDLGAAAAADIPTTPADIGAEPAITSENMLDADLVDDTSSTHKFATAAQLAQIGTNETNILSIPKTNTNRLPFTITANTAGNMAEYAIYGNSSGVGVATDNMFNPVILQDDYTIGSDGYPAAYSQGGRIATTTPIDVTSVDSVTLRYTSAVSGTLWLYSIFNGSTLVKRETSQQSNYTIDVSGGDTLYICFYAQGKNVTTSDVTSIMLSEISQPYQPYGKYKIPITVGDTTTNLIVDSPLTAGDILTSNDTNTSIAIAQGSNTVSTTLTNKPIMYCKYV